MDSGMATNEQEGQGGRGRQEESPKGKRGEIWKNTRETGASLALAVILDPEGPFLERD